MEKEFVIAFLAGLGAMLGWGIADFFAKKTVDKIGDLPTLFWMQTIGILPIFAYFLINPSVPSNSLSLSILIVLYGLIEGFGYIFFYNALEKGKVSIISPVVSTFGGFAVLISFFVFHEPLSFLRSIGLIIILLGVLFSSVNIVTFTMGKLRQEDLAKGMPEAIMSIVLFAIFFPLWDSLVSQSGNWATLALGLRFTLALIALLYSKWNRVSLRVPDRSIWKFLVITGLFDGSAYLFLTWGFSASTQTSITTMLSATYSIPTIILARIFLRERLSKIQWVGLAAIIFGLVYITQVT